ncbi:uncharacterized protein ACMZJ9_018986 [Mantella aurantiaca]
MYSASFSALVSATRGTMKMATYVAERGLLLFCLVAFIVSAKALKCHSCLGTQKECKLTEVTCPGSNDTCGSSTMVINSFPFKEHTVTKGCVSSTAPHRSISISPSEIVKMSLEEMTCGTDLCNKETISGSEAKENERNCYSCISLSKSCTSETMKNMICRGVQNNCLDIRVLGAIGEISNAHIKGCGEMNCSQSLAFSNRMTSVFLKCCNENFCNSDIDYQEPDKKLNGLECVNCDTRIGENCDPLNYTTIKCYGSQTACYEHVGIQMLDGKPTPLVLKGCATPNMCDNSVLPLLQNLRGSRVHCCNGSRCNDKLNKDTLQASGYFPGTGIQSYPSGHNSGIKHSQYPIKTGHAFNNYSSVGAPVSSSYNNDNYKNDNDQMDHTLSFAVIDVPTVSPLTPGGKQNNFNYGSWNSDNNGADTHPTSSSSNGLSGSNSSSITSTDLSQEMSQSQTDNYNSDPHSVFVKTTDNDTVFVVSEVDIVYNIDIYSEDGNNFTATSPEPTKLQGSGDINSYGTEINAIPSTSDGINAAPSGPLSNQNLSTEIIQDSVNNNLGQQNQNSVTDSDQYLSTDGDVFLTGNETDIFYKIDMYILEYYSNLTTTSQGPTRTDGSWDINAASESSYGLNNGSLNSDLSTQTFQETTYDVFLQQDQTSVNDIGLYLVGETIKNNSSRENYTVHSTDNYSSGINNNISTTPQGPNLGVNTTLLSNNNSNSNISSVQHMLNSSSGDYGANVTLTNPNKSTPSKYNCSSLTVGSASVGNNTEQKPPGSKNNSVENGLYHGLGTSRSNSSTHNNEPFSNPMPLGHNNGSNNGTNSSSSYLSMIFTGGSFNGSSSGNYNSLGENQTGSGNIVTYGNGSDHNPHMMPPGGYNGSYDYNSNGSVGPNNPNSTSGGGYFYNSNPKSNSTENGFYYDSGNSRSNSSTHNNLEPSGVNNNGSNNGTNSSSSKPGGYDYNTTLNGNHSNPNSTSGGGFVYNPNIMPPEGSSHGAPYSNENNPGSPYWNYDPNMLPPVVNGPPPGEYFDGNGHDSNYNMYDTVGNSNGNNFMPPGGSSYGDSNGNVNNLGSLFWNPNMPPPAVPGHYSNLGNTMGSNSHQLPPGLNGSTNGNYSNLIAILSNATGLSPTVLSQRLNGTDLSNPSKLNSVLYGIPGFDANRLPPELKEFISGNSHTYSNGPGANYNMPPPKWDISSFGNRDNLINILSNASGISPTILSQRLDGVDISDPSKLAGVLSGIPGFDANKLLPELKELISGNSHAYSNGPGLNYNMPPPKWDISSYGNRDNLINMLSNASGINPALLSQRLNGVDISNPSKLAAVFSGIPGFDANRLPPEIKKAIFGYNSNVSHTFPNTAGYNNMHPLNWNSSNLVNNSYFLNVLSNMTNISIAVLSQKLNALNKDNQGNLTALLLSLPGFDRYRLPPEFREKIFGNDTNLHYSNTGGFNHNMVPPGSSPDNNHFGNAWNNGTHNNQDLSLSGKNTNESTSANSTITFYSGTSSLRSKVGVLAIFFMITLLY